MMMIRRRPSLAVNYRQLLTCNYLLANRFVVYLRRDRRLDTFDDGGDQVEAFYCSLATCAAIGNYGFD